jgi:hypothetical protein
MSVVEQPIGGTAAGGIVAQRRMGERVYDNTGRILAGGTIVTVLIAVIGFFGAPKWQWFVDQHLTGSALSDAQASIRDGFLKLATGTGAVTAAMLAWARLEISKRELARAEGARADAQKSQRATDDRATDAQRLTETGQITGRYTAAVEQLGSTDVAVRLGGLYALERLARDSADDRATVYDVICAWIRHHSIRRDHITGAPLVDPVAREGSPPLRVDGQSVDYRAALTIVLRADPAGINNRDLTSAVIVDGIGCQPLISDINFTKARLRNLNWSNHALLGVLFGESELTQVDFSGGSLRNVVFGMSQLDQVDFDQAGLYNVIFRGGSLKEVGMMGSRLEMVTIRPTDREDVSALHLDETTIYEDVLFPVKFGPPGSADGRVEQRGARRGWFTVTTDAS